MSEAGFEERVWAMAEARHVVSRELLEAVDDARRKLEAARERLAELGERLPR